MKYHLYDYIEYVIITMHMHVTQFAKPRHNYVHNFLLEIPAINIQDI